MQELQTQFSQLSVPPVVPQDEIDALVTAMIQLTEHRLEPYFRALNDAMDETLASSRQQLLSEATRRLAPVLHVVSSCQEYIAKNPQRT